MFYSKAFVFDSYNQYKEQEEMSWIHFSKFFIAFELFEKEQSLLNGFAFEETPFDIIPQHRDM